MCAQQTADTPSWSDVANLCRKAQREVETRDSKHVACNSLIEVLRGHPEVHRDIFLMLWSQAYSQPQKNKAARDVYNEVRTPVLLLQKFFSPAEDPNRSYSDGNRDYWAEVNELLEAVQLVCEFRAVEAKDRLPIDHFRFSLGLPSDTAY